MKTKMITRANSFFSRISKTVFVFIVMMSLSSVNADAQFGNLLNNALVKLGVDEFNLKAVGKGSHEPVADNSTEEGRAKNRRVEFIKR